MLKKFLNISKVFIFLCIIAYFCFNVVVINASAAGVQEYTLTYGIEDDSTTELNETTISMELVDIYGEQPDIQWSISSTHTCTNVVALFMDGSRIIVYTSKPVVPLNASSIYSNKNILYYYYLEPTRGYIFAVEIKVHGETITGYFREAYFPELFEPIEDDSVVETPEPEQPNESTTPEEPSNNHSKSQLDALYDYIDKTNERVHALYIIAILLSVLFTMSTILCLFTLYKNRALKADIEEEFEKMQNICDKIEANNNKNNQGKHKHGKK